MIMHCCENVDIELITEAPFHVAVTGLLAFFRLTCPVWSCSVVSSLSSRFVKPFNREVPPVTRALFMSVFFMSGSALQDRKNPIYFQKNASIFESMHVRLCVAMCNYVWLCVAMYGYVWLCVAMYDYVWLCVAMCGYV